MNVLCQVTCTNDHVWALPFCKLIINYYGKELNKQVTLNYYVPFNEAWRNLQSTCKFDIFQLT